MKCDNCCSDYCQGFIVRYIHFPLTCNVSEHFSLKDSNGFGMAHQWALKKFTEVFYPRHIKRALRASRHILKQYS